MIASDETLKDLGKLIGTLPQQHTTKFESRA